MLAAGTGERFGKPKQFVNLTKAERLVDRAARTAAAVCEYVVLVLPADFPWDGPSVDQIAVGGPNRLASVAAGLAVLPPDFEYVLIHDAAHPLASADLGERLMTRLADGDADGVVPLLSAVDVIKRRMPDGRLETIGRDGLGAAQVPMAFRRTALAKAHRDGSGSSGLREDSELLESTGATLVSIEGEVTNVHIVDQASLEAARLLARDAPG